VSRTRRAQLHLYGLCVSHCPRQGEAVVDYGCARRALYPHADAEQCRRGGRWTAPLDTESVANRCMPVTGREANATLVCALPNCHAAGRPCYAEQLPERLFWRLDPTDPAALSACVTEARIGTLLEFSAAGSGPAEEQLERSMAGMNQLGATILESRLAIAVFGVAMPMLLALLFLLLLRTGAGLLLHAAIGVLCVVLLCATVLCAFKAGLFGDELSQLLAAQTNSTWLRSGADAASSAALSLRTAAEASGRTHYLGAAPEQSALSTEVYKLATLGLLALDCGCALFLCICSAQISIAIEIVQAASHVLSAQPGTLLFPCLSMAALGALVGYALVGAAFIGTLNNAALEAAINGTDAGVELGEASALKGALGAYHLLGFLWAANFLLAASTMVLAGAVASWFFHRNNADAYPASPVLSSLRTVLRFHLGTAAYGSLCLAVAQAVRQTLELVNRWTAEAQEASLLLRLAMSCVRCCMWCFERCIKFVSGYAYVYTALNGDSFCSACRATFSLFLNYPAQVSVNAFVQTLLRVLQCVALPMACAVGCFYYVQEVERSANAVLPATLALVLSYVVCRVFSGVYETTIDTIFVCAMRDKDQFDGRHTPDDLARVLGI
jgi:hypothetical protein